MAARRRTFRFTREGKIFVSVTLGVGLAAVNTGNNLLYLVLGLLLSLLLVSGTLSDVALARIRLRRKPPRRAFAGTTCVVEVELENEKRHLPSYALEVEDRTTEEVVTERSCFFLKVSASGKQTATYRRTPKRRGWLRFERFAVRTRYPFGLIEKGRMMAVADELLVYPKLIPVDASLLRGLGLGEDAPSRQIGHHGDVRGLRDYVDGDGARSIHWRRTAALDRLVVRERQSFARARITLLLDQAEPEHNTPEAAAAWRESFEDAVSRAASLTQAALQQGAAVEVRVRGKGSSLVLPGSPPDPIWRFLALLERVPLANAPPRPAMGDHTLEVQLRRAA